MSGFQWTELRLKNRSFIPVRPTVCPSVLSREELFAFACRRQKTCNARMRYNDVTLKHGLSLRILLAWINISKLLNEGDK